MQRENKWQDRFDEEFSSVEEGDVVIKSGLKPSWADAIKSFIQSEIDTAIAEERNEVVEKVKLLEKPHQPQDSYDLGYDHAIRDILKEINEQA